MKKFVLTLAAAACIAMPAFAQTQPALDPAAVAATRDLLAATNMRATLVATMQQMEQSMPAQIRASAAQAITARPGMSPEQKKQALAKLDADLPALMSRMHGVLSDASLYDEMVNEMIPLYASVYTVDELRQLTAFYQSPLGRKMLASAPALAAKGMEIGQRVMLPRVQKLMSEAGQGTARN